MTLRTMKIGFFAASLTVVVGTAILIYQTPRADGAVRLTTPTLLPTQNPLQATIPTPQMDLNITTTAQLDAAFEQLNYRIDGNIEPVPWVRLVAFPHDLRDLAVVSERKRLFFQAMLPLVLMENQRILQDRQRMLALLSQTANPSLMTTADAAWLKRLTQRYKVKGDLSDSGTQLELAYRVNAVPPSLVLATAANESGWGTSRFTRVANNLFGHWTYRRGTGIVPLHRNEGASHEIAVFDSVGDAVRAYLHNLNTHWAYDEFRTTRGELTALTQHGASQALARTLIRYSERGHAYIDDLISIIRDNQLTRFDNAELS